MPLSYQWLSNGMPIVGASSSNYSIPAATVSESGTLVTVVVSNGTGTATSASATLIVSTPVVAVGVIPTSATLNGGSTQQMAASVSGTSNTAVLWTVSGAGCAGAACGIVSNSGLYTPPASVPSPPTVTVTATSMADPGKSASASLTILAVVSVLLSLNPMNAEVPTSGTQLFTASVTGTSNTAVSWSLNGSGCSGGACGSLATSLLFAVYTGPADAPAPAAVSVVATSMADPTKSATASVTIEPTAAVTVSPASASVAVGTTEPFAGLVTGVSNTSVTWAVSGVGCTGAACGTISDNGLYTAPAAVPSNATVIVTAASTADSTKAASAEVTIVPIVGATYYLAPAASGGNDSNSGTSPSKPWLTPNHALNCGDVIQAAAGTYSATNFDHGKWGTVTCAAGNNVAWLWCSTFDTCKISASELLEVGIYVDQSYWGVEGWEVTTSSASAECFEAYPEENIQTIHHIVFANDIANGCGAAGFGTSSQTSYGDDYLAFVGDIAYKTSVTSVHCDSGFSVYQPLASDSAPGTHIYLGSVFSWDNWNPNSCNGTVATDGNGVIIDTLDGSQTAAGQYRQQVVVDNSMFLANGGRGIQVYANQAGIAPFASVYLRQNTVWGNNADPNENDIYCGELALNAVDNTEAFGNLAVTDATNGCGANPIYAYYVGSSPTATNHIYQNWGYAASGTTQGIWDSAGFSYGSSNVTGNPLFSNPVPAGPPFCSGTASVPACMATMIANFTPTASAAKGYGYQVASTTNVYDPLFPQWLCNVNLPSGLVTMGCL